MTDSNKFDFLQNHVKISNMYNDILKLYLYVVHIDLYKVFNIQKKIRFALEF